MNYEFPTTRTTNPKEKPDQSDPLKSEKYRRFYDDALIMIRRMINENKYAFVGG